MAKASVLTMKTALSQERRRLNRRLRTVITSLRDEMQSVREDVKQTRAVAEMNVARLAQLQAEVDRLKPPK
jgi:hypothetical protein